MNFFGNASIEAGEASAPLTVPATGLYIDAPAEDLPKNSTYTVMEESELRAFEQGVDELIRTVERLKDENRLLLENNATLLAERASLIEKTELARDRVEAMIERLNALEQEP